MGGPSSFIGGGSGGKGSSCDDSFEFRIILNNNESIISDLSVEDDIMLNLIEGSLPRLEVVTIKDGLSIGLAPPTLSKLISCIKNGWEYHGTILEIDSSEKHQKVYAKVEGGK